MEQRSPRLVLNPDDLGQEPSAGMDLAVHLGISQLEVRTAWGQNALTLKDDRLRELREMAEARGLEVAALASPLWKWCRLGATPGQVDSFHFPTKVDPALRSLCVERALRVAELLGTGRVRVFSGLRVEGDLTEHLDGDPLLTQALEMAEQRGVRLLLENEPACTVSTQARLLEVLKRHGHQGLGLWLDLANLHEVGDGSPAAVRALAPYAEYVHIKDYRAPTGGEGRTYVPAGTGEVPYTELLPELATARPGLPYALETRVQDKLAAALTEGSAYLRRELSGGAG